MEDSQQHCVAKFLENHNFGKDCSDWLIRQAKRLIHQRFPRRFRGEDVEDIAQDSVIGAWRGRNSYRRDSTFLVWLEGIVRNTCLLRFRTVKKSPATVSNDGLANPVEASTHDVTQDVGMISSLIEAVGLTPAEEEVFRLEYDDWGEQEDIAIRLGKTENSVKKTAQRARNKMKKIFDFAIKDTSGE